MSEQTMDRAAAKLDELFTVMTWLKRHWNDLPSVLYDKLPNGDYIPVDVREAIVNILRCDTAEMLTVAKNWRIMAEKDNEGGN